MEEMIIYLNEICDKLIQEKIRDEDDVNQLKDYIIKYKQWSTIAYLEDEIVLHRYRNKIFSCNNIKQEC